MTSLPSPVPVVWRVFPIARPRSKGVRVTTRFWFDAREAGAARLGLAVDAVEAVRVGT